MSEELAKPLRPTPEIFIKYNYKESIKKVDEVKNLGGNFKVIKIMGQS